MVADSGGSDGHVREALGLYLLGALKDGARDRVERHLADCRGCCAEADELGAAVELLAMTAERDVREVVAEFGVSASASASVSVSVERRRLGVVRRPAL